MGYDVQLCLDTDVIEGDPSLLCPACSLILLEPERTECGHVYCRQCVKKLRRCKMCDSTLKKYSAVSARTREVPVLLLAKLGGLLVRCAQKCDGVMRLKEYDAHVARQCSKSLIPCANRPVSCDQLIPRGLMRDHQDNECVYRMARCGVCGFRTMYANLYLHERTRRCAQLATRRHAIEQHRAVADRVRELNADLTSWSKWSQYNYIKQTDVKRDLIATLYNGAKAADDVDPTSPQYRRVVRYEQAHSSLLTPGEASPAPNAVTLLPLPAPSRSTPSQSQLNKPTRLYVCQRCDKLYADNMPRSHKECRWHVGPLLLNTFGSTCSTCRRPSYQVGCQFGRHILVQLTGEEAAEHFQSDELAPITHLDRDRQELMRNPSVTPVVDDRSPVFITQSQ